LAVDGAGWPEGDPRFKPGLALIRARQFHSAVQYFRKCLSEGAGPQAWFLLGVAQHALGQREQAASAFDAAAASACLMADARCVRASVLAELGRIAEAEHELGSVIAVHPYHARARLNRGVIYMGRGDASHALADFDALLPAEASAEVHTLRARALFALHRDSEALEAADHALALEPQNARAWLDRVLALSSLHRLEEAAIALERALAAVGDAA
jgi:tetratricopeptide (TPR) repeat protein